MDLNRPGMLQKMHLKVTESCGKPLSLKGT